MRNDFNPHIDTAFKEPLEEAVEKVYESERGRVKGAVLALGIIAYTERYNTFLLLTGTAPFTFHNPCHWNIRGEIVKYF